MIFCRVFSIFIFLVMQWSLVMAHFSLEEERNARRQVFQTPLELMHEMRLKGAIIHELSDQHEAILFGMVPTCDEQGNVVSTKVSSPSLIQTATEVRGYYAWMSEQMIALAQQGKPYAFNYVRQLPQFLELEKSFLQKAKTMCDGGHYDLAYWICKNWLWIDPSDMLEAFGAYDLMKPVLQQYTLDFAKKAYAFQCQALLDLEGKKNTLSKEAYDEKLKELGDHHQYVMDVLKAISHLKESQKIYAPIRFHEFITRYLGILMTREEHANRRHENDADNSLSDFAQTLMGQQNMRNLAALCEALVAEAHKNPYLQKELLVLFQHRENPIKNLLKGHYDDLLIHLYNAFWRVSNQYSPIMSTSDQTVFAYMQQFFDKKQTTKTHVLRTLEETKNTPKEGLDFLVTAEKITMAPTGAMLSEKEKGFFLKGDTHSLWDWMSKWTSIEEKLDKSTDIAAYRNSLLFPKREGTPTDDVIERATVYRTLLKLMLKGEYPHVFEKEPQKRFNQFMTFLNLLKHYDFPTAEKIFTKSMPVVVADMIVSYENNFDGPHAEPLSYTNLATALSLNMQDDWRKRDGHIVDKRYTSTLELIANDNKNRIFDLALREDPFSRMWYANYSEWHDIVYGTTRSKAILQEHFSDVPWLKGLPPSLQQELCFSLLDVATHAPIDFIQTL